MTLRAGDLAVLSYMIDKKYAYIELRDALRRIFYANPRIVMDPNEAVLVLRVEEEDALIVTRSGVGWVTVDTLQRVASYSPEPNA
jgi:hypothetical protein